MSRNAEWEKLRVVYAEQGTEVSPFFSIARTIGTVVTLDLLEGEGRRTLYYPEALETGPHLFDPYILPFPLMQDGALDNGVTAREIPQGTRPLIRIAQSYDTPGSGAPARSDLFNRAGGLLAELYEETGMLPVHLDISVFGYIPEGDGSVVFIPPVQLTKEKNFDEVGQGFAKGLGKRTFSRDGYELMDAFLEGLRGESHDR